MDMIFRVATLAELDGNNDTTIRAAQVDGVSGCAISDWLVHPGDTTTPAGPFVRVDQAGQRWFYQPIGGRNYDLRAAYGVIFDGVPGINEPTGTDMRAAIEAAIEAVPNGFNVICTGTGRARIDPNTELTGNDHYLKTLNVLADAPDYTCIKLTGRRDMIIDLGTSEFLMTRGYGFVVLACENVHIRGGLFIWPENRLDGTFYGHSGAAQGGTNNTITFAANASSNPGSKNYQYIGRTIYLMSGTGAGQQKTIIAYDVTSKVATVNSNWSINPAAGTIYLIPAALPTNYEPSAVLVAYSAGCSTACGVDGAYRGIRYERTSGCRVEKGPRPVSRCHYIGVASYGDWYQPPGMAKRTPQNTGAAEGGSETTIILATSASSINDAYNGLYVWIWAGTGIKQWGIIIDYVGSTRTATIDREWPLVPDPTSSYSVALPFSLNDFSTPRYQSDTGVEFLNVEVTDIHLVGFYSDGPGFASGCTVNGVVPPSVSGWAAGIGQQGFTSRGGQFSWRGCDGIEIASNYTRGIGNPTDASISTCFAISTEDVAPGESLHNVIANCRSNGWCYGAMITETVGSLIDGFSAENYTMGAVLAFTRSGVSVLLASRFQNIVCGPVDPLTVRAQQASLGRLMGGIILYSVNSTSVAPDLGGIAQGGSSNTITLASTAAKIDGAYVGRTILLTSGTGSGQQKTIVAYMGDSRVATVDSAWTTNPAGGTGYTVQIPLTISAENHTGTAQAGSSNTITLASMAKNVDGAYAGGIIRLDSGTGSGQERTIVSYIGSTRIATVDRNWKTNPAADTLYNVNAYRIEKAAGGFGAFDTFVGANGFASSQGRYVFARDFTNTANNGYARIIAVDVNKAWISVDKPLVNESDEAGPSVLLPLMYGVEIEGISLRMRVSKIADEATRQIFAASGVRILLRDGDYATPPEQIATDGDSGVLWYPNIGAGVSKSWIGGSPQLVTTTGRMPNFTGKEYAEHINANSAVDRTLPEILNPGQRIAISSRGNAIHRVLTGGGGRTISGNTLLTFANGANASARSGIVLVCRERSATGNAYSMEIESSYALGGAGTPILS